MKKERVFKMISVSRDMGDHFPSEIKKVRLFNFTEGKIDLAINGHYRRLIGTVENCWIRVYDYSDNYYDFIAGQIYFDANEKGLFLFVSEDVEFISVKKISSMIAEFIEEIEARKLTNSQFIDRYAMYMLKEIRVAGKELQELSSVARDESVSRLDVEDSYEYGRTKLIKRYLLNLIASRIIKENKQAILEMVG